jgi:hypothetical protein
MPNTVTPPELQMHWTGLEGKKSGPQTGIMYWMDCIYFLYREADNKNKWCTARAIFGVDETIVLTPPGGVSATAATRIARDDCRQMQVERGY